MPKNKQGGKKFRGKKKTSKTGYAEVTRPLEFRQAGQEYCRVTKVLGDRRVLAIKSDGSEQLCIIPGKFRFKVWIAMEDLVLINIRDFQDDKADIVYKYTKSEATKLYKLDEINGVLYGKKSENKDNDDEIDFASDSSIDMDNL